MTAITDVAGIRVGHWTDERARTGCTVVLVDGPATGGADVRGGAPGTLGTDALQPFARVDGPSALLLTGSSSYGLAAVVGVMRWPEERGNGVRLGPAIVPMVAAAVSGALFVVNAVGDVVDERGDRIETPTPASQGALVPGESTTIGIVATGARLTKVQAGLLARAAHDGIARAVVPAHTSMDGDTTFAVATGRAAGGPGSHAGDRGAGEPGQAGGPQDVDALEAASASVAADAIRRAVRSVRAQ